MPFADERSSRGATGSRHNRDDMGRTSSTRSLRWRIGGWTIGVFAATLMASTAFRIADERRRMILRETEGATSLLDRIVQVPEMMRSVAGTRAWLQVVEPALAAEDASVAIVPESEPPPPTGYCSPPSASSFPKGASTFDTSSHGHDSLRLLADP